MGAHTSMLAFESPLLMALMALSSLTVWLLLWRKARAGYMLLLLGGWTALCLYWSLLAVSAGPAPILVRADIALWVRVLGIVAAVVMEAGKLLMLWRMMRTGEAERRREKEGA